MLHVFPVLGSEVRGDVMLQTGDSVLDNGRRARQPLQVQQVRKAIRWVGTCLLSVGSASPDLRSPGLAVCTAAASRQGLVPFTPVGAGTLHTLCCSKPSYAARLKFAL